MLISMVSIHDEVTGVFDAPVFFHNLEAAERHFAWLCGNPESACGRFPNHHHLYFVGEFDTVTGEVTAKEIPALILSGKSVNVESK